MGIGYTRPSLSLLFLLLACASPAMGERYGSFLRTDDGRLAAALVRGREQSPTFRAIVDRLGASDLIVYVRRGHDRLGASDLIVYVRRGRLAGQTAAATQLLTTTGGVRYVRVTIELDPDTDVGEIGRAHV